MGPTITPAEYVYMTADSAGRLAQANAQKLNAAIQRIEELELTLTSLLTDLAEQGIITVVDPIDQRGRD